MNFKLTGLDKIPVSYIYEYLLGKDPKNSYEVFTYLDDMDLFSYIFVEEERGNFILSLKEEELIFALVDVVKWPLWNDICDEKILQEGVFAISNRFLSVKHINAGISKCFQEGRKDFFGLIHFDQNQNSVVVSPILNTRQTRIKKNFVLKGNHTISREEIESSFNGNFDKILYSNMLPHYYKYMIESLYSSRGYMDIKVDIQYGILIGNRVDIYFNVNEGSRYTVGSVYSQNKDIKLKIFSNEEIVYDEAVKGDIKDYFSQIFLREEIELDPGDIFLQEKVDFERKKINLFVKFRDTFSKSLISQVNVFSFDVNKDIIENNVGLYVGNIYDKKDIFTSKFYLSRVPGVGTISIRENNIIPKDKSFLSLDILHSYEGDEFSQGRAEVECVPLKHCSFVLKDSNFLETGNALSFNSKLEYKKNMFGIEYESFLREKFISFERGMRFEYFKQNPESSPFAFLFGFDNKKENENMPNFLKRKDDISETEGSLALFVGMKFNKPDPYNLGNISYGTRVTTQLYSDVLCSQYKAKRRFVCENSKNFLSSKSFLKGKNIRKLKSNQVIVDSYLSSLLYRHDLYYNNYSSLLYGVFFSRVYYPNINDSMNIGLDINLQSIFPLNPQGKIYFHSYADINSKKRLSLHKKNNFKLSIKNKDGKRVFLNHNPDGIAFVGLSLNINKCFVDALSCSMLLEYEISSLRHTSFYESDNFDYSRDPVDAYHAFFYGFKVKLKNKLVPVSFYIPIISSNTMGDDKLVHLSN